MCKVSGQGSSHNSQYAVLLPLMQSLLHLELPFGLQRDTNGALANAAADYHNRYDSRFKTGPKRIKRPLTFLLMSQRVYDLCHEIFAPCANVQPMQTRESGEPRLSLAAQVRNDLQPASTPGKHESCAWLQIMQAVPGCSNCSVVIACWHCCVEFPVCDRGQAAYNCNGGWPKPRLGNAMQGQVAVRSTTPTTTGQESRSMMRRPA